MQYPWLPSNPFVASATPRTAAGTPLLTMDGQALISLNCAVRDYKFRITYTVTVRTIDTVAETDVTTSYSHDSGWFVAKHIGTLGMIQANGPNNGPPYIGGDGKYDDQFAAATGGAMDGANTAVLDLEMVWIEALAGGLFSIAGATTILPLVSWADANDWLGPGDPDPAYDPGLTGIQIFYRRTNAAQFAIPTPSGHPVMVNAVTDWTQTIRTSATWTQTCHVNGILLEAELWSWWDTITFTPASGPPRTVVTVTTPDQRFDFAGVGRGVDGNDPVTSVAIGLRDPCHPEQETAGEDADGNPLPNMVTVTPTISADGYSLTFTVPEGSCTASLEFWTELEYGFTKDRFIVTKE